MARILTTQARHLYRHSTTLSIPIWILTLESLRRLEERQKIPPHSDASETVRRWLRYHKEAAWKGVMDADRARQGELGLDDDGSLNLEGHTEELAL